MAHIISRACFVLMTVLAVLAHATHEFRIATPAPYGQIRPVFVSITTKIISEINISDRPYTKTLIKVGATATPSDFLGFLIHF